MQNICCLALFLGICSSAFAQEASRQFSFATERPGFVTIMPETPFAPERGYGFERDRPALFSVALPEGNYRVTVTLGEDRVASVTTVKAELRRLMLENIRVDAGQRVTRSFTVNIRTPRFTGGEVALKAREKTQEIFAWDEKLTLEFLGPHSAVQTLQIESVPKARTIFLLGDSTVCDQPGEPWNSWGQMLPRFVGPTISVANHAESGETLSSSQHARRLDKVVSAIKPGDLLLIQFGHNDMKEKGAGVGAFTTYKSSLKRFAQAAIDAGVKPILVTPVNRKSLDSLGKIRNTLGDYPEAVRQAAKEMDIPLIDLNAASGTLYEAIGPQQISKAFVDGTHHTAYGSYEIARCVVEGLRHIEGLDQTGLLANDVKPFDPSHPDAVDMFDIPASPTRSTTAPAGS